MTLLPRRIRIPAIVLAIAFMPAASWAAAAKNVILFIGDGMGPTHIAAARLFGQRILKQDLQLTELARHGTTACMVNDTADTVVTESAAAASQIATGVKMGVRSISMDPDGKKPIPTILELARQAGKATGLVTTSRITDATSAAFSAHVLDRREEAEIAAQQLQLGVDVLLGGGRRNFLPEAAGGVRTDGRDLIAEARQAGYVAVGTANELRAACGVKLLGLFADTHMSFDIDRGTTDQPSLAEMTTKAIEVLGRNRKGFFLMVEGGRIDHASHMNDTASAIREVLGFDAAVGVAREFQRRHSDTLIVVTADHETGGMALIGNSKTSTQYVGIDTEAIARAQSSFEVLVRDFGPDTTPERLKDAVKLRLGVELTDEEAAIVLDDPIRRLDRYNTYYPVLHSLAFVLRPYYRVAWASETHTASLLFTFADGPDADRLAGFLHNAELFELMTSALGFKLPQRVCPTERTGECTRCSPVAGALARKAPTALLRICFP